MQPGLGRKVGSSDRSRISERHGGTWKKEARRDEENKVAHCGNEL